MELEILNCTDYEQRISEDIDPYLGVTILQPVCDCPLTIRSMEICHYEDYLLEHKQ